MPHVPTMPPASRLWARLAKFECACPKCGEVITTEHDARQLPARMANTSRKRQAAKQYPRAPSVWDLVWNPHTQRLKCPSCGAAFTVGLTIFALRPGSRRILVAPPDTVPNAHERAELDRLGGAWYLESPYLAGQPVNLAIDTPCSCPEKGWLVTCAVHGDPAAAAR